VPEDSIKNFLQYVFGVVEGLEAISQARGGDFITCPSCGTTFGGFKVSGKLGCANCYQAFREQIVQALSNIHGASKHKGKIPHGEQGVYADILARRELDEMRIQLAMAVESERYEDAARYRDIIAAITQNANLDSEAGENND